MSIINQVVKGGGTTPTGSISITSNGTYDVTDKASAVVNVPTTAPDYYIERLGINGKLSRSSNIIDLTGLTSIGERGLGYAYYNILDFPRRTVANMSMIEEVFSMGLESCFQSSNLYGLNFHSLVRIYPYGLASVCYYAASLSSVDFTLLQRVGDYGMSSAFAWTRLTTISFPALETVDSDGLSGVCQGCQQMTSAAFPSLVTAANGGFGSAFENTRLTSIRFPSLTTAGDSCFEYAFANNPDLQSVYFDVIDPSLCGTDVFGPYEGMYAFENDTGITEIHFPASAQTAIEQWTGFADKWGATNATIYFDL